VASTWSSETTGPGPGSVARKGEVRAGDGARHVMAVFLPEVASAPAAREWLGRFLAQHRVAPEVSADASLVLSELVTNALRHGLGEIVARSSVDGEELHVSVTDSGDELPELQARDSGRIGGLGLVVVAEVANDWGVAPFPGGKTVWATFRLQAR